MRICSLTLVATVTTIMSNKHGKIENFKLQVLYAVDITILKLYRLIIMWQDQDSNIISLVKIIYIKIILWYITKFNDTKILINDDE